MNSHKHIKSSMRLVLLLALASLLSGIVYAQDSPAREAESKPNLELKLTSVMPSLCIGSRLSLELAVTNASHEDIVLDIAKLWTQFSYSLDGDRDLIHKAGALGIAASEHDKQLIVLYPGNTIRSTYDFSVASDFFQAAGNYKLQTRINSILSNEVKFTLYDCGKTQKIEDQ